MLDQQDIKKIGALLEDNNKKLVTKDELETILDKNNERLVGRIAIEVGTIIEHNVTPVLDELSERLTRVEAQMVTKSFLTDQLGNLKEDIAGKIRKQDEKMNLLIELLARKSVLSRQDMDALRSIEVFPAPSNPLSA